MKKTIRIVLSILAVLAAIPLGFFLLFYAMFGWEGVTFESRVSEIKEKYDSMTPDEYDKIIRASQDAIELWESRENKFIITYREDPRSDLEAPIPEPLRYLSPRRVDISQGHVFINFLFMMDSGASIIVQKNQVGDWVILGDYSEWDPPYEIYKKKVSNQTVDTTPAKRSALGLRVSL